MTKTKTSGSKRPALTSPVCKAAVLLIKSHVDSRNTAMSLYQISKHAMLLRYYGRYCVKIIMQRIY